MKLLGFLSAVFCAGFAALAGAHEFWIDPEKFQVNSGDRLRVFTRNGQNFNGIDLAYFDHRVVRFDLYDATGHTALRPRSGDSPVLDRQVHAEGLISLVMQTHPSTLTYRSWDEFAAFAAHKDVPDIKARHQARNLPQQGFQESYSRFAKALIAAGSGAGMDQPRGLELELIALDNPYTADLDTLALRGGLGLRLSYQNAPRPNAQIEIFEKSPDGTVQVSTTRTNAEGIARIPLRAGHSYLLDHVVLRRPVSARALSSGAVWETLWTALTFGVPR